MQNLELIKSLTAAIYENAMDGNRKENFKLTNALLEGIAALTDSKFADAVQECAYSPDFSRLVCEFEHRCFVKDVALELVEAFSGEDVTIEADDYDISITYRGADEPYSYFDSGAVLWIYNRPSVCENMRMGDVSKRGSKFFKAECELGTDYGPDVLVSFEAATAKEIAGKVKATLAADREKYPEDVKA